MGDNFLKKDFTFSIDTNQYTGVVTIEEFNELIVTFEPSAIDSILSSRRSEIDGSGFFQYRHYHVNPKAETLREAIEEIYGYEYDEHGYVMLEVPDAL